MPALKRADRDRISQDDIEKALVLELRGIVSTESVTISGEKVTTCVVVRFSEQRQMRCSVNGGWITVTVVFGGKVFLRREWTRSRENAALCVEWMLGYYAGQDR